ncbi:glyceraldehyde 3-phosphate dehydrogenase NAD-binding domain-containing protein, partial [Mycolicibacterium porcinum]
MNSPELAHWNAQEALAEAMIPIIGTLYRAKGVTVLLHSRSLVNKSVISILRTHRFARQVGGDELSVEETFPFLQALADLDLGPSKIDLGLLIMAYRASDAGLSVPEFTAQVLSDVTGEHKSEPQGPRDVVLYGFGRIGRLVARLLIEKAGSGNGLNLRAVVIRSNGEGDLAKRASLLRRDSVHG